MMGGAAMNGKSCGCRLLFGWLLRVAPSGKNMKPFVRRDSGGTASEVLGVLSYELVHFRQGCAEKCDRKSIVLMLLIYCVEP